MSIKWSKNFDNMSRRRGKQQTKMMSSAKVNVRICAKNRFRALLR